MDTTNIPSGETQKRYSAELQARIDALKAEKARKKSSISFWHKTNLQYKKEIVGLDWWLDALTKPMTDSEKKFISMFGI